MSDISIIIVNLNTKSLLKACLDSVFSEGSGVSLEVIVVDNGSTDGSIEMVKTDFPLVRLTLNASNEGFAKPNNDGMRMATGHYLFLLNSDTVVNPGAFAKLKSFLDGHTEAGVCGPMLLYPDGRLQRSVCSFHTLWTHMCDMFALDKLLPNTRLFGSGEMTTFAYDENQTQEVDSLMGAAVLLRREVWEQVGGFDERFKIYYNEMDWFMRIKEKDWKIFYVYDARIIHHRGATAAIVNKEFTYFDEMYANTLLFFQKHYGRWAVVAYKLLLVVGFLPRTIIWWLRRLFNHSEYAKHMSIYGWKTLNLGLRFWTPLAASRVGDEQTR
jgi:GT2 family glycosyltransferase